MILNPTLIWTKLSHMSKWHGSFRRLWGVRSTAGSCPDKIQLHGSAALISFSQRHLLFAFQLFSPRLTSWTLNVRVAFPALSSTTLPVTTQLLISSTNTTVFWLLSFFLSKENCWCLLPTKTNATAWSVPEFKVISTGCKYQAKLFMIYPSCWSENVSWLRIFSKSE